MAKLNVPKPVEPVYTHEGGAAYPHLKPLEQLRRSVLSCLLWEKQFYEDGKDIADRILEHAEKVPTKDLAALIVEARTEHHLRHVPLLLLCALIKRGGREVGDAIAATIQRADELAELLAIYWKDGKRPLSKQMKLGLARAFRKFSPYQLAKYNRDGAIKLRDVLFLVHAKPQDEAQAVTWKHLVEGTLQTPDTWEVALSEGKGEAKGETWTRLLTEGKLGYLALIRNLRNMEQAGVKSALINEAILARKGGAEKLFPFRFIAAAKAAPHFEPALDQALVANLAQAPKLPGKTVVVIDVSGSMNGEPVSKNSDMDRMHAAAALGAILREQCEEARIYATAGSDYTRIHKTAEVPARHGIALVDAICGMCMPLGGGGIFLKQVMDHLTGIEKTADRIIVITDEADCGIAAGDRATDALPFSKRNYMLNVGSYKNGIGYKPRWIHVDGFSEAVVRWILASESAQ